MNFFEQQDRAKRQSNWLVALFLLAVASIAGTIGAIAYALAGWPLVPYAFGAVLGIMLLASAYKTLGLRQGGGQVARAMQGTLVDPNTTDPLKKRLHRVVEEMAIASGVPVPEVYVLEQELGINAFAAGYSPNDAAVAVTRGLLERLTREELQGVIAHEFSHILNGDMRINIRLIGLLFGILVIALMGQHMMHSARFSKNSKDAAPLMFISLMVVVVGYIGLFFGRVIKAAVSRQREYLADAAAVQFTRNPSGISGALKKIAVTQHGSHLTGDGEEISHMLFGQGHTAFLLATHPPIIKRIQAIEPGFNEEELEDTARALKRRERMTKDEVRMTDERAVNGQTQSNLEWQQWVAASLLLSELPSDLHDQAHQQAQAEAFFIFLVTCDHWSRTPDLAGLVSAQLNDSVTEAVQALSNQWGAIPKAWRLPLFEMAVPTLRRRPREELLALRAVVADLISQDGHIDVFEYSMDRLLAQAIDAILEPAKTDLVGDRKMHSLIHDAADLLAIVACCGHGSAEEQRQAWQAGLAVLTAEKLPMQVPQGCWTQSLDRIIESLNQLDAASKLELVDAIIKAIAWDQQVSEEEYALCRTIAGLLSVPLPLSLDGHRGPA